MCLVRNRPATSSSVHTRLALSSFFCFSTSVPPFSHKATRNGRPFLEDFCFWLLTNVLNSPPPSEKSRQTNAELTGQRLLWFKLQGEEEGAETRAILDMNLTRPSLRLLLKRIFAMIKINFIWKTNNLYHFVSIRAKIKPFFSHFFLFCTFFFFLLNLDVVAFVTLF